MVDPSTRRVRTFVVPESRLVDPAANDYRTYEVVDDEVLITMTIID